MRSPVPINSVNCTGKMRIPASPGASRSLNPEGDKFSPVLHSVKLAKAGVCKLECHTAASFICWSTAGRWGHLVVDVRSQRTDWTVPWNEQAKYIGTALSM